jgi:hypothetical protein
VDLIALIRFTLTSASQKQLHIRWNDLPAAVSEQLIINFDIDRSVNRAPVKLRRVPLRITRVQPLDPKRLEQICEPELQAGNSRVRVSDRGREAYGPKEFQC